jgi:hypothetical protein
MERPYSIDRDLMEAREMAEGLAEYVRGDQLFGTVGDGGVFGGGDAPSLTIGNLLMRLRRLQALEGDMLPAQKALLTEIEAAHDEARTEWDAHYNAKLIYEFNNRIASLRAFLTECEDNADNCADNYLIQANIRTLLQDIVDALKKYHLSDLKIDSNFKQVDLALDRLTDPSDFLWDLRLGIAYPREKYWWLYARPSRNGAESGE